MIPVHFLLQRVLCVYVSLFKSIAPVHSVPSVAWLDIEAIRRERKFASSLLDLHDESVLHFFLFLGHFFKFLNFSEWICESILALVYFYLPLLFIFSVLLL